MNLKNIQELVFLPNLLFLILCIFKFKHDNSENGYRPISDTEDSEQNGLGPPENWDSTTLESFLKNWTLIEALIFYTAITQIWLNLIILIIVATQKLNIIPLFHYIFMTTSWIFFVLAVRTTFLGEHKSRHFYPQLIMALGSHSLFLFVGLSSSDNEIIMSTLEKATLGLLFPLIILDLLNPKKDAALINSSKIGGRVPSPESTASLYSLITFSWVNELLSKGKQKPLESEDFPHLCVDDKMSDIIKKWKRFRDNNSKTIVKDAILFTKRFAFWQLSLSVITTVLDFSKPFFINRLLTWIQTKGPDEPQTTGLYLLAGMVISSLIRELLYSQIYLSGRHWGIQLRSIFVFEIFTKSLRRTGGESIPDDEDQRASQGRIVSLMSSDVNSLRWFLVDIHTMLIDIPLSTFISISGLLYLMGPSALAGLIIIIISGPVSSYALNNLYKLLKATRTLTDKRIHATNEALLGIRIIKFMAWEAQFLEKILRAREEELDSRFGLLKNQLLLTFITWSSSILVTFVSFFSYTVLAGHSLDAATAFTAISLLNSFTFVLNDISQTVSQILNIKVTLGRLNKFLAEDELVKFASPSVFPDNLSRDRCIGFKDGEFGYYASSAAVNVDAGNEETQALLTAENDASTFKLCNMNLVFPKGKLTTIVGPTGSGKSSILLTLLGELRIISGYYAIPEHHLVPEGRIKSDIAYVSQNAWLMSSTIRENILFGEMFDQERYNRVISACCLLRDFSQLEYGDLTEIGEKGVNLSGGQKQRISLARAAYSSASIVLLDDPLSAVDAPTVTHAINLVLPKTDFIIVMRNGSVEASGTPEQVLESGVLASSDLIAHSSNVEYSIEDEKISLKSTPQIQNLEGKATGSVKFSTYQSYIVAAGGFLFILGFFICFFFGLGAEFLQNYWIEIWTDALKQDFQILQESILAHTNAFTKVLVHYSPVGSLSNSESGDSLYYITIFGLISFVELFAVLLKFIIQFIGGIRASRIIHERLAVAILGSPLRFFELTPVGRLINRFSKDLSDIDGSVLFALMGFGTVLIGFIFRILIISIIIPYFALSSLLVFFYWRIARFYLASSREIKRLESVSNSPIYALFGEVLNGVSTIRAFGAEYQFINMIQKKVDANHRAYFYLFATNRWLTIRISFVSYMVVFIAGVAVVYSNMSAGWAGLTFSFTSQITRLIAKCIQVHSSMEMAMAAVERLDEYTALPQEPLETLIDPQLLINWPTHGEVKVHNLTICYDAGLPNVLKGISFKVKAREKIGIVGRTGAGKSTLSLAFFRILPFLSGTIFIDGVDISKIGVRHLRSKLTIIPQDPVLFEGTLRSSLDPLQQHTDAEINDVLRQTHVIDSFQQTSLSLDDIVSENGSNYSQGQRQLLCMARALLRSSKLVFFDEATSSIDHETDLKIQTTIRKAFGNATILTVAHRLKTVIDFDRILVLDGGSIKEIGTPFELFKAKDLFYSMCKDSGDFEELYETARKTLKAK